SARPWPRASSRSGARRRSAASTTSSSGCAAWARPACDACRRAGWSWADRAVPAAPRPSWAAAERGRGRRDARRRGGPDAGTHGGGPVSARFRTQRQDPPRAADGPPQPQGSPSRALLYWRLVRMHKPIGTLLLLWPTMWALLAAADGHPAPYLVFAFTLGTLLMRSAGCAINDWADRDIDLHVERTRERPLTSGLIRPWEAVAVFVTLSLLAGLLILPMNTLVWKLAFVAVFLAASYPFTKRFF